MLLNIVSAVLLAAFCAASPGMKKVVARQASQTVSCPAKPIVGQFWPSWVSPIQNPWQIKWDYANLAMYFTAITTADGVGFLPGTKEQDIYSFVSAAKLNNRKPIITIGGWTGSKYFSSLVTDAKRDAFVSSVKRVVDKYGFVGVDIDWEFPGEAGNTGNQVSPNDTANLLKFCQRYKQVLGASKLLTLDVPIAGFANGATPPGRVTDMSGFAKVVDYLIIMAYEYTGPSWSTITGPNAPLRKCSDNWGNIEETVNRWLGYGFPACRTLLAVPSYSHQFATKSSTLTETTYNGKKSLLYQHAATSQPEDPTDTFNKLVSKGYVKADGSAGLNGFVRYYDECTQTPFLFNSAKKLLISYDDKVSLKAKGAFARSKGLAGVVFYESSGPTTEMFAAANQGLWGV